MPPQEPRRATVTTPCTSPCPCSTRARTCSLYFILYTLYARAPLVLARVLVRVPGVLCTIITSTVLGQIRASHLLVRVHTPTNIMYKAYVPPACAAGQGRRRAAMPPPPHSRVQARARVPSVSAAQTAHTHKRRMLVRMLTY